MSNLSTTLSRMLERKGMSAAELSRLTDIDRATISRWKNGSQLSISDGNLKSIAQILSDAPAEQAELVMARMLDLKRGPGADLIKVEIQGGKLREPAGAHESEIPVPPKMERALQLIRANSDQSEVRDIVYAVADLLKPKIPKQ